MREKNISYLYSNHLSAKSGLTEVRKHEKFQMRASYWNADRFFIVIYIWKFYQKRGTVFVLFSKTFSTAVWASPNSGYIDLLSRLIVIPCDKNFQVLYYTHWIQNEL